MRNKIKWMSLSVIWILMRLLLIPLGIVLFLFDMIGSFVYLVLGAYAMLYNRHMALFGIITIDVRMMEEELDNDKDYIDLAKRDKDKLTLILKRGK